MVETNTIHVIFYSQKEILMKKEKLTPKQKVALQKARRTLKEIDFKKFWKKVIRRVAPKVDANDRVRARSAGLARTKFIPNHS